MALKDVFQGEVFVDGSCLKHFDGTYNRAGWGLAVVSQEGALLATLCGPVPPHLPQTSPVAEHMALVKLAEVAAGRVEAVVDYTGLMQNFQPSEGHWAMQPGRPMAGLVRKAHMAKGWPAITGITKV